jgi:hypothetical protein
MDELAGDDGTVSVDALGDLPERGDNGVVPVLDASRPIGRCGVRAGRPKGLDHGRSFPCLGGEITEVTLGREPTFSEMRVMRRAHDSIFQLEPTQTQR